MMWNTLYISNSLIIIIIYIYINNKNNIYKLIVYYKKKNIIIKNLINIIIYKNIKLKLLHYILEYIVKYY